MSTRVLVILLVGLGTVGMVVGHFALGHTDTSAPAGLSHPVRAPAAQPRAYASTPDDPPVAVAQAKVPLNVAVQAPEAVPALVPPKPAAAPPKPVADPVEVARLRDEVQALRQRSTQLEAQLAQLQASKGDSSAVVSEIKALRAQVAAEADQRQQTKEQAAAHSQAIDAAVNGLITADSRLATGDTQVMSAIEQAERVLNSRARADLGALRHAIENNDIGNARAALQQAIYDSQTTH